MLRKILTFTKKNIVFNICHLKSLKSQNYLIFSICLLLILLFIHFNIGDSAVFSHKAPFRCLFPLHSALYTTSDYTKVVLMDGKRTCARTQWPQVRPKVVATEFYLNCVCFIRIIFMFLILIGKLFVWLFSWVWTRFLDVGVGNALCIFSHLILAVFVCFSVLCAWAIVYAYSGECNSQRSTSQHTCTMRA